jgi:putative membrane protein
MATKLFLETKKIDMKKLLSIGAALCIWMAAGAQTSESSYEARSNARIGKMKLSEFMEINAKGNQMVNAITPDSKPLSAADQQLFVQVANGGMRQLMISQAVLAKATNEQVRTLAQSEVEEQTNVSNKLKQIASAKGATMPQQPDAETQSLVSRIQNMGAEEVNLFYIRESGIKGHELLRETMNTVKGNADDDALEALAKATLPVIKTHLKVSKKVENQID